MREGHREELIKMQNEFKLDLILTNSIPQVKDSSIFETKLLCREELIVVGHPKFKVKGKWPEILKHVPFILPTYDSNTRQKVDFYLKQKNLTIDVIAEVEDKATEIDLALNGNGLIVVMRSSVTHLLKDKSLIEFGALDNLQEEVWMMVGKRKLLNPLALFAMKNFTLSHK